MTREEQIQFCRKCMNKKMDMKQGLICLLTGQKATFETECPDFKLDANVEKIIPDNNEALQATATIQENKAGKSSFPNWIIYILILIGLNILSAIFDWPFWIY